MRRRQPPPEHAEAVSRRLETLRAELGVQPPDDPDHAPTRIRGLQPPVAQPVPAQAWAPAAVEAPVLETPAVEIPVPGRHASRRVRSRPALPDLPGLRVTTSHAKVVAVLCAVALAGAVWAMTTGRGEEPRPVAPSPAGSPLAATPLGATTAAPTSASASAAQETGDVTVDVAGKVRRPQIVVLPAGSRVTDAIEAAGGARRGVDLTPINLARVLVDGEQIVVGLPQTAAHPQSPAPGGVSVGGPPGALVNINTADQALLETLPGVGPVTATSIIAWRTDNAGFSSVSELLEVDGIGDATLSRLTPLVTV